MTAPLKAFRIEVVPEYTVHRHHAARVSTVQLTLDSSAEESLRRASALSSPCHLGQQSLDLILQRLDLGVDLLQRSRRHVLVEVPRQRDLVADLGLSWSTHASGTYGSTSSRM